MRPRLSISEEDRRSTTWVKGKWVVTGTVRNGVTRLAVGRKSEGDIALLPLAEVGIPVLHAFDAPKGWSL